MRHYLLLSYSPASLANGVTPGTAARALITRTRPAQ
jgi:hypothetical protein